MLICAAIFVAVSASHDHYWDEYFYLYSVRHHTVGALVGFEADLSGGLFPDGFFSGKIAFVWLLSGLVALVGDGTRALAIVQFLFALLVPVVAVVAYRVFRHLIIDEPHATRAAVLCLFLPLTVYFGWKPLSEMPALLFVTAAGWQWLRGLSDRTLTARGRAVAWTVACLCLSAATLCRITSGLGFIGLVGAAVVMGRAGAPLRAFWSGAALFVVHLIPVVLVLAAFGRPDERLVHLVQSVTGRSVSGGLAFYAAAMTVQTFAPFLLVAVWPPLSRAVRGALVWLVLTAAPFLVSAGYVEPRFLVLSILPLAILVEHGLSRTLAAFGRARAGAWVAAVALMVLVNRAVFAPLMPIEFSQQQYGTLVEDLERQSPAATILTPWLSDYCFLAYAYPQTPIVLTMSESFAGGTAFSSDGFARWVRPGHYAGNLDALRTSRKPWFYVGWTYSPTVLRASALLQRFPVDAGLRAPTLDRLLDHRTPSWIWRADSLRKEPTAQRGDYYAYRVVELPETSVPPAPESR